MADNQIAVFFLLFLFFYSFQTAVNVGNKCLKTDSFRCILSHYYSSPFFYSDDPSSDEPDMKFVSAGAALYRRRLEKGQQNKTD